MAVGALVKHWQMGFPVSRRELSDPTEFEGAQWTVENTLKKFLASYVSKIVNNNIVTVNTCVCVSFPRE